MTQEPESAKIETVLLIHGTYAANGLWWRPESSFCTELNKSLSQHGCQARAWKHIDIAGEAVYTWSGENSEIKRREEAASLTEYLLRLCYDDRIGKIHIVCHSHGGNLLYYALNNVSFHSFRPFWKLGKVIFLGTPFIHAKKYHSIIEPRDFNENYGGQLAFGILLNKKPDMSVVLYRNPSFHVMSHLRTIAIYYKHDEAFLLLQHARALRNNPASYGSETKVPYRLLLRALIPNFYRRNFSISRLLLSQVSPNKNSPPALTVGMTISSNSRHLFSSVLAHFSEEFRAVKEVREVGKIRNKNLPEICFLLILPWSFTILLVYILDALLLAPTYYIYRIILKKMQTVGLKVAAKAVLGDDFILDGIETVHRLPVSVPGCTGIEIDKIASNSAIADLVSSLGNSVTDFFEHPTSENLSPEDIKLFLQNTKKAFSNPRLLHCRYYLDIDIINNIAKHIACNNASQ